MKPNKAIHKELKVARLHINKILDHDSTNINENIKSAMLHLIDAYMMINKK